MIDRDRSTVRAFVWPFIRSWFRNMSGPLSVPFVFLTLFVTAPIVVRAFFGVLAVSGLLVATYTLWRREHMRVLYLEARLRSKETNAAELTPWLSIEPGELVLVPSLQSGIAVFLGGENIPSGIYAVFQHTRLTNRSTSPVSLVPTLWRRLGEREWRYPSTPLPERVSGATMAYGSIIQYLGGAFEPVINLGPMQGDARRLVFRMPGATRSADKKTRLDELHQCEFALEMYDTLSEARVRQPIQKTGDTWRVDD